jgi:hypothetical protein
LKRKLRFISLQPADISAEIKYKNGTQQRQEFYYGSSFLSQSARFMSVDDNVISVTIKNSGGHLREIK